MFLIFLRLNVKKGGLSLSYDGQRSGGPNELKLIYVIYLLAFSIVVYNLHIWVPIFHMAIQVLINCKLCRSQLSLHTTRRCIPNVPTYISIDHEHQNGIINSSLVGVIIGDWKFYNHQGLCFNSRRSLRRRAYKGVPLMQREDRGFDPRQEHTFL
ncbi:hypothetical protein H8356DRAFT_1434806 [Neocallimastix lanati (nom. inval.)]|nr:hypothetical protein H8356DRAFT_1434806 [Neocallimastix sp. JGI-2020a]